MLRHVITFQRESVHTNKFARILLCPGWKNDITELNTALLRAFKENVAREIITCEEMYRVQTDIYLDQSDSN